MKGKSREEASEAELKVMEEIESLISKQPEVQKTMQQLKMLEEEFDESNRSANKKENFTQRKN